MVYITMTEHKIIFDVLFVTCIDDIALNHVHTNAGMSGIYESDVDKILKYVSKCTEMDSNEEHLVIIYSEPYLIEPDLHNTKHITWIKTPSMLSGLHQLQLVVDTVHQTPTVYVWIPFKKRFSGFKSTERISDIGNRAELDKFSLMDKVVMDGETIVSSCHGIRASMNYQFGENISIVSRN